MAIVSILTACQQAATDNVDASASSAANNDDTTATLKILPDGYLVEGYTESYAITGSDSTGKIYTGSYEIVTAGETIFNGEYAVPVVSTLNYGTALSGQPGSLLNIEFTEYYSPESPHRYLGNRNSRTGVIMMPAGQAEPVPSAVDTLATGSLGDFTGSDASEEQITWSSSEINNDGSYQLAYSYLLTDSAGGVLSSETQVYIYDGNNNRTGWSLTAVLSYLSNTLTFSGTRL